MNNFRGGFGGFGGANIQNLMKQAQKMQEDMEKAKEEIMSSEFTATAGGGMCEAVVGGDRKLKKITLKPAIVDPDDIEMLEDLIVAVVNEAIGQVDRAEKEKLPNIPGM